MAELHNRYCLELLFFGLVKQRRERKDANVNREKVMEEREEKVLCPIRMKE